MKQVKQFLQDALKPFVYKGFGLVALVEFHSQNVAPLLYLENEKPRNPATVKGLRFVQKGLKKF